MHIDVHICMANNILIHTDLGPYLLLIWMSIAPGRVWPVGNVYVPATPLYYLGFASFSEACCSVNNYRRLILSISS